MEQKATAEDVTWDFVDAYLKKIQDSDEDSKAHFTVETLVGVVTNFLMAGSASTASTIHWHMLKYAMEPDTLQARVQCEIDEVIGRERRPAWEDRLRMPFTMACVWEMDRWKISTPLGVPRDCPGEILATVEVFLGVTSLLQRFRVLPDGKVPFDINCPSILASHVQHLKLRFLDRGQNL
ncbi:hypothetical protein MTO96_029464 [Rhipicephalus appendiculatus]